MKRIINFVKKSLAAVLAASMVFTALPVSTFAEVQQVYADEEYVSIRPEGTTVAAVIDDGAEQSVPWRNDRFQGDPALFQVFFDNYVEYGHDDSYYRIQSNIVFGRYILTGLYVDSVSKANKLGDVIDGYSIRCDVKKADVDGRKIIITMRSPETDSVILKVKHSDENPLTLSTVKPDPMNGNNYISANAIPASGASVASAENVHVKITPFDSAKYVYEIMINDRKMPWPVGDSGIFTAFIEDVDTTISYSVAEKYQNVTFDPNDGEFPASLFAPENGVAIVNDVENASSPVTIKCAYWDGKYGPIMKCSGDTLRPQKEGYGFGGWFVKGSDGKPDLSKPMTEYMSFSKEECVEYICAWNEGEDSDGDGELINTMFTLNPNGGSFTKDNLAYLKDWITKTDDKTGAISFNYWKEKNEKGEMEYGYSIGDFEATNPVRDGYMFTGWYEKNEDGTPNFNKPFRRGLLSSEEECVDVEYVAGWAKDLPVIDEKNIKTETVDGKYVRTIFSYNKDELKSLYDEKTEVLLVLYENWTKVPNDINDEIDKNGNYVNWNAAPVDFNYNPFVFVRELYKNQVENDTDAWIRYKYVVIKKDTQNNPNNYILNRWSNKSNILREAKTWSKEFKVTLRNEKATAGGDIVEEDTRYDNIAAVTRKDLTKDNTEISEIKAQTYNGTYLKPTVSVKFKENADSKPVVLVEGVDYIKSYENNLNAGTAKVVIKGNGLYKGTIDKEFTIAPKSAKKLKVTAGAVKAGDNTSVLLEENFISVFDGTEILAKDVDYTVDVSAADLSKKGKTKITVKGKNNYSDEELSVPVVVIELKEGEELIRTAKLKASVSSNLIYNGAVHRFTTDQFEVSTGTRVLETAEYTVSAKNVKDVGTGYVTIKAKNKQVKGSVVIPVEILPNTSLTLDITGKDDIKAVTYNGKLQRPKVKVTSINPATNKPVTLKLNKDYKLIYANNIHATNGQKTAEVKVVGIGNYENAQAVSAFFEIKPVAISKAKAVGEEGKISLTFNKHDIINTVDYTLSDWTKDATGKKSSVTITGKGDFTGEVTKTFKVPVAK